MVSAVVCKAGAGHAERAVDAQRQRGSLGRKAGRASRARLVAMGTMAAVGRAAAPCEHTR